MEWYNVLKSVHVLGAVVWVGGALMTQLYAVRVTRSGDAARTAAFAKDTEFISMRAFIPASLALVLTGFAMVADADWNWDFWLVFGIVIWALSFLAGILFLGPESGRIGRLIEEQGAESPEAQRRISRIFLFSRVELALLLAVVVAMTAKWGT